MSGSGGYLDPCPRRPDRGSEPLHPRTERLGLANIQAHGNPGHAEPCCEVGVVTFEGGAVATDGGEQARPSRYGLERHAAAE